MRLVPLLVLASAAFCAAPATAVTCYTVFNRDVVIIYQDVQPPVDLSITGIIERDAMKRRGEHMISAEFETCLQILPNASGGTAVLSADDVVKGLKSRSLLTSKAAAGSPTPPGFMRPGQTSP